MYQADSIAIGLLRGCAALRGAMGDVRGEMRDGWGQMVGM